jgi:glycosyltransferase involved in cell wall biosynthesis
MARRFRLLVLASTYPRWAGDHEPGFVHELARRLLDRFEVTVLCPHAPGAARAEDLDGVRVVRYRYGPSSLELLVNDGGIVANLRRRRWLVLMIPGFLLAQAWEVWRLVRVLRPEVIHAHWLIPQGLLAACLAALHPDAPRFVVTSHGADLFSLRERPLQALKRFVLRRAAAITVVSEGMRQIICQLGGDRGRVQVAPMGVDLSALFTAGIGQSRSSDEIVFVGRLVEKKGLRVLLEAMPLILGVRPHVRLTVVGFGPELEMRQQQVRELGLSASVQFLGAVMQSGLPAIYRRAAVFVAPFVEASNGDQEGLGLVTIEALGCGCPAVVSTLPGTAHLRELPTVYGVPPGDSSALARAVLDVLAAPPGLDQREASRRACIEAMDWSRVAARYGDILALAICDTRSDHAKKLVKGGK